MTGQIISRGARFAVGLTGGIGSGKTRVANAFAERGATIVDTDVISHQLTTSGGAAIAPIREAFGAGMITDSGTLDRRLMREAVFADPAQKARLESIMHPLIRTEVVRQMEQASGPYTIVVVPLLAESGHWKFDRVLVIDCDVRTQIERVTRRDGLREELVKSIIAQQASRDQRLAIATEVLSNQAEFAALIPEIEQLHEKYCELARAK